MAQKSKVDALVLLDRDGVVDKNLHSGILRYSDFKIVPHLSKSLSMLNSDSFRIAIITNQPYIQERILSRGDLVRMNKKLLSESKKAGIKAGHFTIKICPHAHGSTCNCRKPKPGLIKQAVKEFGLHANKLRFYLVGDNLKDLQTLENYYLQALKPMGMSRKAITTIFLVWKYGEDRNSKRMNTADGKKVKPDFKVKSLHAAFKIITNTKAK